MSFETYKQFYDGGNSGTTVRVGGARVSFFPSSRKKKKYRLFTMDESEQCYWWKNEPDA